MNDRIVEQKRELEVIESVDIVVVGGGTAGVAAAVAAGRHGADVLLIERYGCLGGLATGGLVIMLWSFGPSGKILIKGMPLEILEKLKKYDAVRRSSWCPETRGEEPIFDPEIYKFICLEMVKDAKVNLLLHTWAVRAIVKGNKIEAVITESKSGRQVVRAKMFIDASGDGDLAEWCKVPYEKGFMPVGLDVRFGGIDGQRLREFYTKNSDKYRKLKKQIDPKGEFDPPQVGWRDDVAFSMAGGVGSSHNEVDVSSTTTSGFDNTCGKVDAINVRDLTRVEIYMRKRIMEFWKFYKENVPGFENSFILDTASQIGTRESRRITGEYVMTAEDVLGARFDDSIGKGANWLHPKRVIFDIPYRSLVPKKVDNLLFAGRCISTTHKAHNATRVLVPCIVTGQAAGTAAVLGLKDGVLPREIDIKQLQNVLEKEGVNIR